MSGAIVKRVNWWAILFLPILLRTLVPVGCMPVIGPDFSVKLVICDGDGPLFAAASMPMSMSLPMDVPAGMVMDDAGAPGAPYGVPDSHRGHADHGTSTQRSVV